MHERNGAARQTWNLRNGKQHAPLAGQETSRATRVPDVTDVTDVPDVTGRLAQPYATGHNLHGC